MQHYPLKGKKHILFYKRCKLWLRWNVQKVKTYLISDYRYNKRLFEKRKNSNMDLINPKTYSEKLLYLKMYYRNPLQTLCADKYYVSEYVKACGYEHILKKVFAVYDKATDFDYDMMPERFFLRCNHWSGFNYVVDKGDAIDIEHTKRMFSILLKHSYYEWGREWPYKNIQPRLICEEFLENPDESPLIDYKFYCFSGEPRYFMVSLGEYEHEVKNHKFNMDLQSIDYLFKEETNLDEHEIRLPNNIGEMIEIVKKLCKPFPHVRVDLYNIEGRIIFGELTFFSSGGIVNVVSEEYDREIASWINLDKYKDDMII